MPFLPKRDGGGGNAGHTSLLVGAAVVAAVVVGAVGAFPVGSDAMGARVGALTGGVSGAGIGARVGALTGASVGATGALSARTGANVITTVGLLAKIGAAVGVVVGGGAIGGVGLVGDRKDCHQLRNDLNKVPRKSGDSFASAVVLPIVVPL
jgi:hypothetical protein